MRTHFSLLFFGLLAFATTGCGPDRATVDRILSSRSIATRPSASAKEFEKQNRLSQIDRELEALTAEDSKPDAASESELDARAAQTQDMITALNLELSIRRSTDADELNTLRFRQEQDRSARQVRLMDLAGRIQEQKRILAEKQIALDMAIAPEGGELRNRVEADYALTNGILNSLETDYANLLSVSSASPELYYSEQREKLDAIQARQLDLSAMIRTALGDIAQIAREKAAIRLERQERARQIGQLKAERDTLMKTL